MMNRHMTALAFLIVLAAGSASLAADSSERVLGTQPIEGTVCSTCTDNKAAGAESKMPPPLVEGEVLKIEPDFYMVKDRRGKEIKIQLDQRTMIAGSPKVGDQIIAQIEPQGYAYSIKREASMEMAPSGTDTRSAAPAARDVPGVPSTGDMRGQ
jgi:hypothetical protein